MARCFLFQLVARKSLSAGLGGSNGLEFREMPMNDGLIADAKDHIGEVTAVGSDDLGEAPGLAGKDSAACLRLKTEIAPFLNGSPL